MFLLEAISLIVGYPPTWSQRTIWNNYTCSFAHTYLTKRRLRRLVVYINGVTLLLQTIVFVKVIAVRQPIKQLGEDIIAKLYQRIIVIENVCTRNTVLIKMEKLAIIIKIISTTSSI